MSTKNNTKGTRITEQEYSGIKMLINMNTLTNKQLKEITQRSEGAIHLIKKSKDFTDYHDIITERWKSVEKSKTTKEPSTDVNTQILLMLNKLNDTLQDLALAYNHNSERLDEVLETKRPWINRIKK